MIFNAHAQPLLLGLLAAFFWGTHSTIVRFLSSDMPGITSAAVRVYIAAASLPVILVLCGRRPAFRLNDRASIICAAALSVNFVLFHWGLGYTSASNAMLLENTAPIFVLFILFAGFREKLHPIDVAATLCAVTGVFLTVRQDLDIGGAILEGDYLEIAAGLTWAIFIISASKSAAAQGNTLERVNFLLNLFAFAAVVMTPFAIVSTSIEPFVMTSTDALLLVLLGVFPTAIAYFLWYEAASKVSTVAAALLFTLTVVFTFANAAVFLGEVITPPMAIGAILIVAAVLLLRRSPTKGSD